MRLELLRKRTGDDRKPWRGIFCGKTLSNVHTFMVAGPHGDYNRQAILPEHRVAV